MELSGGYGLDPWQIVAMGAYKVLFTNSKFQNTFHDYKSTSTLKQQIIVF